MAQFPAAANNLLAAPHAVSRWGSLSEPRRAIYLSVKAKKEFFIVHRLNSALKKLRRGEKL
jgi:hypothetical protein